MGKVAIPSDVMLFSSIIYKEDAALSSALDMLEERFGPRSFTSDIMVFDYTSYYEKELGSPLVRVFVAFERLVPRDQLAGIKLSTNDLEAQLAYPDGKRSVNIDPGLITLENVVLATTKPYSHRIYLGKGIWCEITLMYRRNSYSPMEWTYPDYESSDVIDIFNALRERLKRQGVGRQNSRLGRALAKPDKML